MSEKKEKFKMLLDKAKELGYSVKVMSEEKQIAKLTKDGKSRFVVGPLMPLNTTVSAKISRDKNLTKEILSDIKLTTPRGGVYTQWSKLEDAVKRSEISYPLVVKPNDAALGSAVSVDIRDIEGLKQAFDWVQENHTEALVEEFIPWEDFRLFVVDGKMVAAAKRVQPFVTGDGESTLAKLIDELNETKKEKKVQVDEEAMRYLKMQEVDMDSVIKKDEKIVIRGNANIQTGGFIVDVTYDVASNFIEIAEKAAHELGLRLAGVDMLCEDITNGNSGYVITELNGLPSYPYVHGHPDIGTPRDPIDKVLDAVFRDLF